METESSDMLGRIGIIITILFMSFMLTFVVAIPAFIFIFIIWNWDTAASLSLWVSAPIALIYSICVVAKEMNDTEIENKKEAIMKSFMDTQKFNPAKTFNSVTGRIAISEDYSKIILSKPGQQHRVVYPSDLVEMVLEVNDSVESKSSSGVAGSIAGAALGGVLTGGTGAIVGAIAGKGGSTTTRTGVSSIIIKLVIKNIPDPLFVLTFLEGEKTWERTSTVGKHAIEESNDWWAALSVFKSMSQN